MLNKYLSLPIRIHFLIFVILLAVPFFCIILYIGMMERKDALKDAENDCLKFVSSIAREEQVLVMGIQQLASTIALFPEISTPYNHKYNPLLKEILKANPQYTNITISDAHGRILESAVPFQKGTAVSHLKYFRETVRTGMFSSGEYIIGRMTKKPIMVFGHPVKNATGQITGVIGIGIDFIYIRHAFDKLKFPDGSSFSLLDHKGAILYRHLQDNLSTKLVGSQDIKQDIFTRMQAGPEESTFTAEGNDGNWRVFAYKKMSLPHEAQPYLYIRSSIPQSSVIKRASHRSFTALFVGSLLSFIALYWAWFIGKRIIVDRVTALEKASKQLAAGNEIVEISKVVQDGDLGELAKAIDRMIETMAEKEATLRSVLEAVNDSLYMIDSNGTVLALNTTTAEFFGKKPEEILGRNIYDFLPAQLGKNRRGFQEEAIQSAKVVRFEDEQAGRCFESSLYPVLVNKDLSKRVVIYSRDITTRKKAEDDRQSMEERLNRSEKMEALGQLAGGVAHDLNNVLGILSGYSELLRDEIPEDNPARSHVDKILQSTKKGAAIIQDLLTLARRGVMVSNVINLNTIVSDFLETPVFDKFKDYHPHVTFRTESDESLLNIKGSPVHLEKALMNLVSNAAEAITETGEVTIRTANRHLDKPVRGYDEVKEGDYAVWVVSDTGMGIPAENMQKIFEPFYTKKKMGKSGTGLGLAIVWGTVKDHNGYIDVRTAVGMGTTFTLYFPVTQENLVAPEAEIPLEQYMGKGETVLVVDDRAGQREIASRLLMKLGYQVHQVSSGEEAVEYLKTNKADILVLDMIMTPGIDGLETYRRILEINPKQKAIIVSGFSETDRTEEAQKLGAGAYVKKPYVLEKIGVAIRDELNR